MLLSILVTVALVAASARVTGATSTTSYASRLPESTIAPSVTQIIATEATQVALSPVSNVEGAVFDRIVQIWLENTVRSQGLFLAG